MRLAVSTDKGLVTYQKDNGIWVLDQIHFLGMPVGTFIMDKILGTWYVAINHKHWGPKIHCSKDRGLSWREMNMPKFDGESDRAIKSIWTIVPANNRIYVGVEPAAIFISQDDGSSYKLLEGLSESEVGEQWMGGGRGSRSPFLHTILIDPEDPEHLFAGISCAGVYQSFDGGDNWIATNDGSRPFNETPMGSISAHDPHCIRIANNPNVIWQQNHEGIYRSEDKGRTWVAASKAGTDPHYGFALVIDDDNDQEAWAIPAQSDDMRFPRGNALKVCHTIDGGQNWQAQIKGLPQEGSFDLVLRRGMAKVGDSICFGTTNGNVYLSEDRGNSWTCIAQNLSSVRDIMLY